MKSFYLLIFIGAAALSGCKKERVCVCRDLNGNVTGVRETKSTKKEAAEGCEAMDAMGYGTYHCNIEK